ncbi:hypothetical protein [Nocardia alni]|uniref:hypothetical protein n=1 Tax=Nocardia alni TaxID=2815723 RepID=UPI001C2146AF|nr:hypothetical protein [Nocardia alni]
MITKLLTGQLDPRHLLGVLERTIMARWPLVLVFALAALLVWWVARYWVRRWREEEAGRAVWLRVHTPASVVGVGDAGVFARRVAGVLHRTRRIGVGARHVVLEVAATGEGTQIGVWVPPGVDRAEIAAAITGAWPSAEVTATAVPALGLNGGVVVAKEVTARNGAWAPWIDPHPATSTMMVGRGPHAADPLGGVLERLAARGAGETGFIQLVLGTYHRATVSRLLLKALDWGLSEFLALLRFAISGPRSATAAPRAAVSPAPLASAVQKAVTAKQAAGPHLSATLRVGITSAGPLPHGRAAIAQIAGGFDAVATAPGSGGLVTHRTRHNGYRVAVRRPGRRFVATIAEVAALWHLPTDAARYGLPTVRSHDRAARPALRLPGHPPPTPAQRTTTTATPARRTTTTATPGRRTTATPLRVPEHELSRSRRKARHDR